MQEIDASSDLAGNLDHPLGPLLYTISTMHCMTVSLAVGGAGLGTVWGVQLAERMLGEAGLAAAAAHRLPDDPVSVFFHCRRAPTR